MKKLFAIVCCLLCVVMASAEEVKMALLQPRVAQGSDPCRPIELNMVRGELRKAFGWQSEFQVLTRTDVDDMLAEHGFQNSGMVDDDQRKQVGVMTGAQYICVSTITKDGSQLYIEAYLVNIETGQMTNPATQFAKVIDGDYSSLQAPCNELAKEMLGELATTPHKSAMVGTPAHTPTQTPPQSTTKSDVPAGYVDLGLPSGTLWKAENEDCDLISYEQAVNYYGEKLPTKEQWEELKNNCLWTWSDRGCTVKGKNGETMYFPLNGFKNCKGITYMKGGLYWSSTPSDKKSTNAWVVMLGRGVEIFEFNSCTGSSIRLVR